MRPTRSLAPKAGDNEDLRGLLNAGHQRGRPALRYDAGHGRWRRSQTFAMAALAGIGAMPDTIEDRAAVIRMRRRAPGEKVAPYRVGRDGPELDELRQRLNQWLTAARRRRSRNATPDMPLEDRAADTWEPMIAVADLAGGHWPRAARKAAVALTSDRDAGDEDIDHRPGCWPTAAPPSKTPTRCRPQSCWTGSQRPRSALGNDRAKTGSRR